MLRARYVPQKKTTARQLQTSFRASQRHLQRFSPQLISASWSHASCTLPTHRNINKCSVPNKTVGTLFELSLESVRHVLASCEKKSQFSNIHTCSFRFQLFLWRKQPLSEVELSLSIVHQATVLLLIIHFRTSLSSWLTVNTSKSLEKNTKVTYHHQVMQLHDGSS